MSTTSKRRVALTNQQRRHLRALGHHLDPVVQLGKHGLTEGVSAAVDEALERHELIKVRFGTECPDDRDDVAAQLSEQLGAEITQTLGRTILLYRRHPKEPKIVLPGTAAKKGADKAAAKKGTAKAATKKGTTKTAAKKGAGKPAARKRTSSPG